MLSCFFKLFAVVGSEFDLALVSSSTEVVSLAPPISNSDHNGIELNLRQQPASREPKNSVCRYAQAVADPGGVPRVPWNPSFKENSKMYFDQTVHATQKSKLHV